MRNILSALLLGALFSSTALAQTTYFSEDFDSWPAAGWTQQNNGAAGAWTAGSPGSYTYIISGMAFHDYGAGQADNMLISPAVDLSGATGPVYMHWFDYLNRVKYMAHHSAGLGNGVNTVEASTDGGATWTVIWTETRTGGLLDANHIDLSSYAGTSNLMLGFRYTGDNAQIWGLDEIRIDSSAFGKIRSMVNPANGHTYIATYKNGYGGVAGFNSARAAAADLGGYVATATDAAENTWIWENFSKWNSGTSTAPEFIQRSIFLGGTDEAVEGTWVWESGEAWSYTNWAAGEPNNSTGVDPNGEDYLRVDSANGNWQDKHEAATLFIVVEVSGPSYSVSNLVAGQVATFDVSNATPMGLVRHGYSVVGGGPTSTPFGDLLLTPPYTEMPALTADASGNASLSVPVPAGTTGVQVWFHGLDMGSATFLNSIVAVIC